MSGYAYNLKFNPAPQRPPNQDRRRRNIIWFNAPFNRNVLTHVGRAFINLVDKCFPTGHKLRKLFNRNTVKLSYSCSPSMKQLIDGHNKAILRKDNQPVQDQNVKTCNCRNKNDCPLQGECLQKEIVYQATVTTREEKESYVGLTATAFKTSWRTQIPNFVGRGYPVNASESSEVFFFAFLSSSLWESVLNIGYSPLRKIMLFNIQ